MNDRAMSLRFGHGGKGLERMEASLAGTRFAPHRHDTYAIGLTLSGVQSFRYRGVEELCLPGQVHVLHPDERHDGAPASEQLLMYRIAYLDPKLVSEALSFAPLPFVSDPVLTLGPQSLNVLKGFLALDDPLDEVSYTDFVAWTSDLLERSESNLKDYRGRLDVPALLKVRDLLYSEDGRKASMNVLEHVSGLDRWTLARQFRRLFGTSPSRFRTMRQLDLVRELLRQGESLAEVANMCGFSDQAHMTRKFKSAYGLPPNSWRTGVESHRRDIDRGTGLDRK